MRRIARRYDAISWGLVNPNSGQIQAKFGKTYLQILSAIHAEKQSIKLAPFKARSIRPDQ